MSVFQILMLKIKEGTFFEIVDDWKWIISYSKKYKWAIAYYIVVGIASTLCGIASAIASKYLIDIITGYQIDQFRALLMMMIASSLLTLFLSSLLTRISTKISLKIYHDIQLDIFEKIIDTDWLELNQYSHGDILNRFNSDVQTVADHAITWLPTIIIYAFQFIAVFCVIFHYDVKMAFIALSGAPLLFLISRWRLSRIRDYNQKVREMSSQLMSFEVEAFYHYDLIKSFGITDTYCGRLKKWQLVYKNFYLNYNQFSIYTQILISLAKYLVSMIAFCYCLYLLWTHQIAYGTMTLFLSQGNRLSAAFNQLASIVPGFLNSSVSAHRIRELAELKKERHLTNLQPVMRLKNQGIQIQMEDISFIYEKNRAFHLNASFKASPGEIVAIIGPSGEGKTTLLRLMLGLIVPTKGAVHLIGTDGAVIDMNADARCYFSYVPQGNSILSGTIAENMRIVKEAATDEEIIQALKIACAWDFIQNRPESIDWSVGEQGAGLSEGQAQRIAIARALLRDAPILLLDEATSALDIQTEQRILKNILQQKPDKTCIMTTHRMSVLALCHSVYEVIGGTVTEYIKNTEERREEARC